MENQKTKKFEIDIVELFYEIKNRFMFILVVTAVFTSIAIVFFVFLEPPKYTYEKLIDCPDILSSEKLSSYVSVIKNDKRRLKKTEESLGWLKGIEGNLSNVEIIYGTKLIKLTFEGTNPSHLKEIADSFAQTHLDKINDDVMIIYESDRITALINQINSEIRFIENKLELKKASSMAVNNYTELLRERLDMAYLQKKRIIKAKLISYTHDDPVRLSRFSYIVKSASLGFLTALLCLFIQYCWRKIKY